MSRMSNYVVLARLSIEAEFPELELTQAFGVLNVGEQSDARIWKTNHVRTAYIARLAHTFNVDADELVNQLMDFRP